MIVGLVLAVPIAVFLIVGWAVVHVPLGDYMQGACTSNSDYLSR